LTPPSEKESGVTFTIPITDGRGNRTATGALTGAGYCEGDGMSDMEQTPPEPEPASTPPTEPTPPEPGASPPPAAAPPFLGTTGKIGETRSIGLSILWFIITLGIYGLYWVYKTFEEMKQYTGEGIGGVLALVIHIVVGPVIWFVAPSEVGKMYKRDSQQAPVTGWAGLWNLIPIVGTFIWFFKVQGSLNRYWISKGAT
jgi:hypothetical protein